MLRAAGRADEVNTNSHILFYLFFVFFMLTSGDGHAWHLVAIAVKGALRPVKACYGTYLNVCVCV